MKRALTFLALTISASSVFAYPNAIQCNATEECPVVSESYKKARKVCNQSLMMTVPVYQQQEDGNNKHLGYTCVQFSGN
ncbi:MAG: hypothetical protein ACAH59_01695 [Pseudobdellovibrionaceae bacterium]